MARFVAVSLLEKAEIYIFKMATFLRALVSVVLGDVFDSFLNKRTENL